MKAITKPIPQLFCRVAGELQEVDMVIAADTVTNKGAKDLVLCALAALAEIPEIPPTWDLEKSLAEIKAALMRKGLNTDGVFQVLMSEEDLFDLSKEQEEVRDYLGYDPSREAQNLELVSVGTGIFGKLQVMRAQETEFRQSSSQNGMSTDIQLSNISGMQMHVDPEVEERIAEISAMMRKTRSTVNPSEAIV